MTVLRARKNQTLELTDEQNDILVGCILGDAYITKRGQIQIEHSASQREYVDWKYERLRSISYGPPKKVIRTDRRNGKKSIAFRFWAGQFFREWRERFYSEGRKVVPVGMHTLSPLTLAVWHIKFLDPVTTEVARSDGDRFLFRIYHTPAPAKAG